MQIMEPVSLAMFKQNLSNPMKEILEESQEIRMDYSQATHQFFVEVKNTLLVIGNTHEAKNFASFIKNTKRYEVGLISPDAIDSISGHIGAFEAKITQNNQIGKIAFSQMVIFYEDEELIRFMGCENAQEYENQEELLKILDSRLGKLKYFNPIHYQERFCQYHQRRPQKNDDGWCHRCVDVCPTFGISKNNQLMQLNFSGIDCISCGQCIMVCPSGAIKRDSFSIETAQRIAKLYHKITPVILNDNEQINEKISRALHSHSHLPFFVPQIHLLNPTYLLSIIQESSSQIILYDNLKNEKLAQAAKEVNLIFSKIYQQEAIFLAHTEEELLQAISHAKIREEFFYTYSQNETEPLYQIFSERLKAMVRTKDYGNIQMQDHGRVFIDEDKCTLCMSCVGACNVQSLSGSLFTLFHNPSLCTTCGYCIDSCPENAISSDFNHLVLAPHFFENVQVAKTDGFACVECNKVFASKKSIEKIQAIMTPLFGNDKARIRSLYCCETCKVKVMFNVESSSKIKTLKD